MECWQCALASTAEGLFCPDCGALQPPDDTVDHFGLLGVEAGYEIDLEALETTHHDLVRRVHPDRFLRREPREHGYALQLTTALNDALRTLRDPVLRAEYLLAMLVGGPRIRPLARPCMIPLSHRVHVAVAELQAAVDELDGFDGHVERRQLMWHVADRFEVLGQRIHAGFKTALQGGQPDDDLLELVRELRETQRTIGVLRKLELEVAAQPIDGRRA